MYTPSEAPELQAATMVLGVEENAIEVHEFIDFVITVENVVGEVIDSSYRLLFDAAPI